MRNLYRTLLIAGLAATVGTPATADWNIGDQHKMHYAQLPDSNGLDVNFTSPLVLADDWKCISTGLVRDIHFWFSAGHDSTVSISSIRAVIRADIPANPQENVPYSRPGALLWQRTFTPSEFTVRQWGIGDQGWYVPRDSIYAPHDHQNIYQCNIDTIPSPFVQHEGTIYWLVLSVSSQNPLGWKTSLDHFNDDAVWAEMGTAGWNELRYPPGHDLEGESIDLAFVITGPDSFYESVNDTVVVVQASGPIMPDASRQFVVQLPAAMKLWKGGMNTMVDLQQSSISMSIGSTGLDGVSPVSVDGGFGVFDAYMWGAVPVGQSNFTILSGMGEIYWPMNAIMVELEVMVEEVPPALRGVASAFAPIHARVSGLGWINPNDNTVTIDPGAVGIEHHVASGVDERPPRMLSEIVILPNTPNPFRGATSVAYRLPAAGSVEISVYDVNGRRVRSNVIPGRSAGWNSFEFDGRDGSGVNLPSGIYFLKVTLGSASKTRKIVIVR